jgi:hypothetical protein
MSYYDCYGLFDRPAPLIVGLINPVCSTRMLVLSYAYTKYPSTTQLPELSPSFFSYWINTSHRQVIIVSLDLSLVFSPWCPSTLMYYTRVIATNYFFLLQNLMIERTLCSSLVSNLDQRGFSRNLEWMFNGKGVCVGTSVGLVWLLNPTNYKRVLEMIELCNDSECDCLLCYW